MAAVLQDGCALRYASRRLRSDRKIVRNAVREAGIEGFYGANGKFWEDRRLILEGIRRDGISIGFASTALLQDRKLAREAVKRDAYALMYLPENLRDDKRLVRLAVSAKPLTLSYASLRLQKDRELLAIAGTKRD